MMADLIGKNGNGKDGIAVTMAKLVLAVVVGGVSTIGGVLLIMQVMIAPVASSLEQFVEQETKNNERMQMQVERDNAMFRAQLGAIVEETRETNNRLGDAIVAVEKVRAATEVNGVRIQATNDKLNEFIRASEERLRELEKKDGKE